MGAYKRLSESTRALRRSVLRKFSREHGDKPFALVDRKYLERASDKAPTPIVARTCLLAIRPLMQWAVTEQLIEADPTIEIKIKLPDSDGHHTWTEEEVAQFQARHPIGTKAHLALELLLSRRAILRPVRARLASSRPRRLLRPHPHHRRHRWGRAEA